MRGMSGWPVTRLGGQTQERRTSTAAFALRASAGQTSPVGERTRWLAGPPSRWARRRDSLRWKSGSLACPAEARRRRAKVGVPRRNRGFVPARIAGNCGALGCLNAPTIGRMPGTATSAQGTYTRVNRRLNPRARAGTSTTRTLASRSRALRHSCSPVLACTHRARSTRVQGFGTQRAPSSGRCPLCCDDATPQVFRYRPCGPFGIDVGSPTSAGRDSRFSAAPFGGSNSAGSGSPIRKLVYSTRPPPASSMSTGK